MSDLDRYIRDCADLLGLKDWQFTIKGDDERPAGLIEGVSAAIEVTKNRRWFCLYLPRSWWSEDPRQRKQTVAHELLHCHLEPMRWAIETVQTNLGDVTWGTLADNHLNALELAVDSIAEALCDMLPEPPQDPRE